MYIRWHSNAIPPHLLYMCLFVYIFSGNNSWLMISFWQGLRWSAEHWTFCAGPVDEEKCILKRKADDHKHNKKY